MRADRRGVRFTVHLELAQVREAGALYFVARLERARAATGILTACKGVILSCNAECERMFGYGRGELHGRRVADLVAATAAQTRQVRFLRNFF